MNKIIRNILDQIPADQIYKYLSEKENACKKQNGSNRVGSVATSRKAKEDAIRAMTRELVK